MKFITSVLFTFAVVPTLPAQRVWVARDQMLARRGAALAYDAFRQRVVMFGGSSPLAPGLYLAETHQWDGSTWTRNTPTTSPPARELTAMAYDPLRGRTVLFGGWGSLAPGPSSDTWEWDGSTWTQQIPAVSPPARAAHAVVYDSLRQRIVVFGGQSSGAPRNDLWEWDGAAWTQRTTASSPSPRSGVGFAYDDLRGRLVIFGGSDALGARLGDTWEWDGANWAQRTPGLSPPPRYRHAMVYDGARGRTLLFGGVTTGPVWLDDTWEWDGTTWTGLTPAQRPPATDGHGLAYDAARARVVLHGGGNMNGLYPTTWEWDGTTWMTASPRTPGPRRGHALAYEGATRSLVLFGGFGASSARPYLDTWRCDGAGWHEVFPLHVPPARLAHVLTLDALRDRVVLFGGWNGTGVQADTWEWDGTDWLQRTPPTSPPARYRHAMAYDETLARVVLFGGDAGNAALGDHWEWDGSNWTMLTGSPLPPARVGAAMCRDSRRARIVLHGGSAGLGWPELADTWEFDGAAWSQRLAAGGPPARRGHALAFDAVHGVSVLSGGERGAFTGHQFFDDTWEWDGSVWRQTSIGLPAARADHAMVFDAARGSIELYGGNVAVPVDDAWQYRSVDPPAYIPFGSGCGGVSGTPAVSNVPSGWPLIGGTLSFDIVRTQPSVLVAVQIGLSRTHLGGLTLPLSLAFAGMPGCTLYQSWDLQVLTAANAAGTASWSLPIPNNPRLLGFTAYCQAWFVDPTANPAGVATTDGVEVRVGS